tara:strand:- start:14753 stop:15931 length:1179 start_codon:yes stop_codon:yes gene_type:complete
MKTSHFFYFLLAIILFSSCWQGQNNNDLDDYGYEFENSTLEDQGREEFAQNDQSRDHMNSGNPTGRNNGRIQNYQIKDTRNNMIIGTLPIPASWRTSGDPQAMLEGPNGVKVYNEQGNFFSYSNDPYMNQLAQQTGQKVQPPKSVENVIQQDLIPLAQQQGAKFVKSYPIPQLARFDEAFDAKLWKYMPTRKQFNVMAAEFTDNKGKSSIVIVRHQMGQDQMGSTWGYVCNMMESNTPSFEQAKQAYINGLINLNINPQWIQACNQRDQQRAQQSNAGHQQRMAQIKAFGEQNTRNFNARSAASDAQYNSWREGQAASDAGQAAYVDGIWERQNMTDGNGNTYKIDGYDNNVWMNQNNEYISTDNSNWNPNIDNATNNDTWNQLQSTDDGDW